MSESVRELVDEALQTSSWTEFRCDAVMWREREKNPVLSHADAVDINVTAPSDVPL